MAVATIPAQVATSQALNLSMPSKKRRKLLEELSKSKKRQKLLEEPNTLHGGRDNASDAPYADVRIATAGELLWILHQQGWIGSFPHQRATLRSRVLRLFGRELALVSVGTIPADLRYANLGEVNLTGVNLDGAKLQGANLRDTIFHAASLIGADLRGARLDGADVTDARLLPSDQEQDWTARFPATVTPPPKPLAGLQICTRNELLWLLRNYGWLNATTEEERERVDLRGSDLQNADVFDADVEGYDLDGAVLISDMRIGELEKARDANETAGKPRYAGVEIRTRQELLWIKLKEGWSGAPAVGNGADPAHPDPTRADLREAVLLPIPQGPSPGLPTGTGTGIFSGSRLFGANLRSAKLDGADLTMVELSNANLSRAEMSGTTLDHATLDGARLPGARLYSAWAIGASMLRADLRNAALARAIFCGSNLSVADLRGADCLGADARGVDLRGAKVDAGTSFIDLTVDSNTQFGDIVWYSLPLLQINWKRVGRIGDEHDLNAVLAEPDVSEEECAKAFGNVIRAYRELSNILRRQGFYADASRLRLRQKWIERRQLRRQGHPIRWLISCGSNIMTGYGERPWGITVAFALVVVLFWLAYYVLARFGLPLFPASAAGQLSLWNAGKLSVFSLVGRQEISATLLNERFIGGVISFLTIFEGGVGWLLLLGITVLASRQLLGETTSAP